MSEITNIDRAKLALAAVETFEAATGSAREDSIIDLLDDLMHLCKAAGLDFYDQLRIARNHFEEELKKERALFWGEVNR